MKILYPFMSLYHDTNHIELKLEEMFYFSVTTVEKKKSLNLLQCRSVHAVLVLSHLFLLIRLFCFSLPLSPRILDCHQLQCVDTWKQSNCQLTVPKEIDVSSQMLLYNTSFTQLRPLKTPSVRGLAVLM